MELRQGERWTVRGNWAYKVVTAPERWTTGSVIRSMVMQEAQEHSDTGQDGIP